MKFTLETELIKAEATTVDTAIDADGTWIFVKAKI